jgi:hypothetical protein
MIYAERAAGNKYTKKFDWSPPIIQSVQAVRYWQLLLKCSKGKLVSQSTIDATYAAVGLPIVTAILLDRPAIVRNLGEAIAHKRLLQINHVQHRDSYLTVVVEVKVLQKSAAFSQELKNRQDKEIKQLIHGERKKRHKYKKIGWILSCQKNQYGGLHQVDISAAVTRKTYLLDLDTWLQF